MSGPLTAVLPVFALLCVLAVMLLVQPRRRRLVAIDEKQYPELADLRRTSQLTRTVAILLGIVAAAIAGNQGPFGRGLMLAPITFSVILLLGIVVGDLLAHGRARDPYRRGADLASRSLRQYLPRALTGAVAVGLGLLVTLTIAGTLLGSADDAGRPGRALANCTADGTMCAGSGPWPGSFYALPLAIGVVVLLLTAAVASMSAVRRPRGSDPEIVRVDEIVRRRIVESIVAATGVGLGSSPRAAAGWACVAIAFAGIVLAVWSGSALLTPGAGATTVDRNQPRTAAPYA